MNCDRCRIVWFPWTPPPCEHEVKDRIKQLVARLIRDEKAGIVSPKPHPDGYIARWLTERDNE